MYSTEEIMRINAKNLMDTLQKINTFKGEAIEGIAAAKNENQQMFYRGRLTAYITAAQALINTDLSDLGAINAWLYGEDGAAALIKQHPYTDAEHLLTNYFNYGFCEALRSLPDKLSPEDDYPEPLPAPIRYDAYPVQRKPYGPGPDYEGAILARQESDYD